MHDREFETILKLYSESQRSAEHHKTLLWDVIAVTFVGLFVLLGFVIQHLEKIKLYNLLIIPLFPIVILVCLLVFIRTYHSYVVLKYDICKQIEKKYFPVDDDYKQHTRTETKERERRGEEKLDVMINWIYFGLMVPFILIWFFIFYILL